MQKKLWNLIEKYCNICLVIFFVFISHDLKTIHFSSTIVFGRVGICMGQWAPNRIMNQNNFIDQSMELSLQGTGSKSANGQNPVLINYTSNRIRDYYPKNRQIKNQVPSSSTAIRSFKAQSLNKIQINQQNSKIEVIKLKCFRATKPSKNIKEVTLTKSMEEDDIQSCQDVEQETDDCVLEKNDNMQPYMRRSKFNGRPPTVFFQYPTVCDIRTDLTDSRLFPLSKADLKYKINGWQYKCIINSLEFNGFRLCEEGNDWNVYFDIRGNKTKKIEIMNKYQKLSHFPGCWYIGRKDFLWRGIHKIRRLHPEDYNFVPMTYLLPADFQRFEFSRDNANKNSLWIMKPAASACGRGIKMIGKDTKVRNRKQYLISQYVSNPHLINNLKYDLRVYVVVTSYDPLRIYLFQNGLVRFATHEYNCKQKDIKKKFVHLTNFSVNKHSKNFVKNLNADSDNQGSKWSFKALRKYYHSVGIDSDRLFQSIEDVVIKTCISAEPNMLDIHSKSQEKRNCCFELYGFDILIDSTLKPWLMEVNVCPSLSSSSPMDRRIKHTLITDMLNLIGIEYKSVKEQQKARKILKDNFCQLPNGAKRIYSRNINNLDNLCFENCIEILSPEDWLVLLESEEELDRIGHFKKIFPLRENIPQYERLFQFRRYYNIMLWRCLQSRENFLDHILKN